MILCDYYCHQHFVDPVFCQPASGLASSRSPPPHDRPLDQAGTNHSLLSGWVGIEHGPIWAQAVGSSQRYDLTFGGPAVDAAVATAHACATRLRGTDRVDCRLPGQFGDVLLTRGARLALGESIEARQPVGKVEVAAAAGRGAGRARKHVYRLARIRDESEAALYTFAFSVSTMQ